MNFSFPEEYEQHKQNVIEFAQSTLNNSLIKRDAEGIFPRAEWEACAQFGIQKMAAPDSVGGPFQEINLQRSMLAMEGFGYGCKDNGLAFGLNAQMWTVQIPLTFFGNEMQQSKFLKPMVEGNWIGAHALTEPNAGSDIFNMQTTAKKVDGGYVLNGQKRLITFAPIADFALVFANANPKVGKWGICAFLVESGTPGFNQATSQDKMGLRSVPIGQLTFKDCFVSDENRLGKEGMGFSIMNHSLEYDRCGILASQLGAMERQLEETIKFVQERKQFGQAVGKFQSVSNRIADMKLRLETSRLLLYKVAWKKQSGDSAMLDAALLKLQLGESFLASSLDAIRCRGGIGFLSENEIERDARDSVGSVLYAGTSDIQRNIIASLLGV